MDEQNEATYGKPCDWNELKVQLNNVTIMHGPASVTLAQAEEAMLRYIGYLAECDSSNATGERCAVAHTLDPIVGNSGSGE